MSRLKPVILALDDDEVFRKILETVLKRLGVTIRTCANESEFFDALSQARPDLYLIDLQLGSVNGLDIIKKIRSQDTTASVVVISGVEEQGAVAHALENGANDFILKPLDKTLLASKLSQFVTTEELDQNKSKYVQVPALHTQAKLVVSVDIEEIDELGVRFSGASLIPKGTVLKLTSKVLPEIGIGDEILIAVTNTWLDQKTGKYGAYAEFDGVDVEFLQKLRQWLTAK